MVLVFSYLTSSDKEFTGMILVKRKDKTSNTNKPISCPSLHKEG